MDLGTLGDLGDFVGGVGVLITLVYLAFQIRQNTATTRVQTVQQILNGSFLANVHSSNGPVPDVLQKVQAGVELDEREVGVYTFFVQGVLAQQWQIFYQRQNGMVEESLFEAYGERNRHFLSTGLFRAIWTNRLKVGYPKEFQEYVEQFLLAA